MTVTSKPLQTSTRWATWGLCFVFFGALILLFIVGNRHQEDPESIPIVRRSEHSLETIDTQMPVTVPNPDTDASNVVAAPAVLRHSNPFKAFLEAHRIAQISTVASLPVEENPLAKQNPFRQAMKNQKPSLPVEEEPLTVQSPFREAIKNQKPYVTISPFATWRNPNNTNGSR